ncbi:hypothetical protein [Lysinibacillus sphaericus]|nr:hypothetical protein [Lysinibacillus sphaericus]
MTVAILFSWFKYRKEVKIAKNKEEIRNALVRFMLILILFLIFIASVVL